MYQRIYNYSQTHLIVEKFGSFIHALLACLSSDWATTTGKQLGPTTSLANKDGGISFSALPKETNNKAYWLVFHTVSFVLSAKQGNWGYHFLKSFGMTCLTLGNVFASTPFFNKCCLTEFTRSRTAARRTTALMHVLFTAVHLMINYSPA